MNNENLKTITYTISYPNFKYHVKKGKMLKNSVVSKKRHPIQAVEDLKKYLLKSNMLKDLGENYLLKKDFSVGALMAYNLYCGMLKKEFDNPNPIIISETSDQNIADEFQFENIFSTDSLISKSFEKNSRKIEHIYNFSIRRAFLIGNNPNQFSETEKLVYDVLKLEKIISNNARHGETSKKESDIVDESQGIQIEIVTAFKLQMKDKTRLSHDTFSIMELINTNLISISKGIFKKFYEKEYTDKYEKRLAIFSFGDLATTKTFLKRLISMIEENPVLKNDFTNIYFITYDFILDEIYIFNGKTINSYKSNQFNINYIKKFETPIEKLKDEEEYLLITKNIFNKKESITVLDGKNLKQFIKDFKIIK